MKDRRCFPTGQRGIRMAGVDWPTAAWAVVHSDWKGWPEEVSIRAAGPTDQAAAQAVTYRLPRTGGQSRRRTLRPVGSRASGIQHCSLWFRENVKSSPFSGDPPSQQENDVTQIFGWWSWPFENTDEDLFLTCKEADFRGGKDRFPSTNWSTDHPDLNITVNVTPFLLTGNWTLECEISSLNYQ